MHQTLQGVRRKDRGICEQPKEAQVRTLGALRSAVR